MGIFLPDRFELLAPYGPEECRERILAGVSGSAVKGTASATRIQLRKRFSLANYCNTYLSASIHRSEGGSVITGSLEPSIFMWVFIVASVMVAILAGIASAINGSFLGLAISVGIVPLTVLICFLGRLTAGDEGPILKAFVIRALDAVEEPRKQP